MNTRRTISVEKGSARNRLSSGAIQLNPGRTGNLPVLETTRWGETPSSRFAGKGDALVAYPGKNPVPISPGTFSSDEASQPLSLTLAFSLVEVLVAVSLMTVIVIGLMAMFNQTQRAFRLGMTQTDVLESGRIATDMIARELEQARPAYQPFGTAANFTVETTNRLGQPILGKTIWRTNLMQDVFFLQRENQTWTGIGYFVRTSEDSPPGGVGAIGEVGTLYRFETSANIVALERQSGLMNGLSNFFIAFNLARQGLNTNGVSRILDGVVDFQVRTFVIDRNGVQTTSAEEVSTNSPIIPRVSDYTAIAFFSNAVPFSVELELGILEQQSLEHYRALPVATAKHTFYLDQAAHEHVFRQRVPIRNVDPSAYRQ